MAFNPFAPVNEFNAPLTAEAQAMAMMMSRGRFKKSVLDIQTVNANETQQQPFALVGGIGTPNPAFGVTGESTVIFVQMEPGFNAIITGMFWGYDPGISSGGAPNQNNWVQGDGQLSFSLRVDLLHIPGYTNINVALGSVSSREKIDRGIPILAGQMAEIDVTVALTATTPIILDGSRIVAGLYGVKFPCS